MLTGHVSFYVIPYSRGEAPHLNCPRSRCLHHISSEAGHIHGSCTQTGRGDSMCHLESGSLKVRTVHLNLICDFNT